METLFRLSGVDGEATEDIIESFSEEQGEYQDPEDQFKIASILCQEISVEKNQKHTTALKIIFQSLK